MRIVLILAIKLCLIGIADAQIFDRESEIISRAVVVGISDYQDPKIPDLKYAHRDAQLFAGYLKSSSGGSLKNENIKLLINNEATAAQIIAALSWLMDESNEGDRAIIYFSCHGDAEQETMFQLGYLLAWDSPPNVYGAGAIPINFIQAVISSLSIQKNAAVQVYSDACRAGKLAGNNVGGTQIANTNLMKQFGNESKILSCQPNEFSLEGSQWGDGSGVFTYHLIDGLYGMADQNGDLLVSLLEIENYLEKLVPLETAPHSQIPITTGDKSKTISKIDESFVREIQKKTRTNLPRMTSVESKSLEMIFSEIADPNDQKIFQEFLNALEAGHFLGEEPSAAEFYFDLLIENENLFVIHGFIKRNYAAALQDDAQQVINKLLKSDPEEHQKLSIITEKEYGKYPFFLRKAANLLGEDHYMYRILMARSYWFEGYLMRETQVCNCYDPQLADTLIPILHKSLSWYGDMPETWMQLALAHGVYDRNLDSMEYYAQKASKFVPNWISLYAKMGIAYLNMGFEFYPIREECFKKAKVWMDKGLEVDSNSVVILNDMGYWYQLHSMYDEERKLLQRSLSIDSIPQTMHYLGLNYLASRYYDSAEKALLKAIEMDSNLLILTNGLVELYSITSQYDKAFEIIERGKRLENYDPSLIAFSYTRLGWGYRNDGFFEEAMDCYAKAIEMDSTFTDVKYYMSSTYMKLGSEENLGNTLELLENILELDPTLISALIEIGLVHLKLGNDEIAQQKIAKARELSPDFDGVKMAMFLLELESGNEDQAKAIIGNAIELEKQREDDTNIASFIRDFYFEWPWYGDIENIFLKILEWYPDYALTNYELARHLSVQGETDKAFKFLRKSLDIGFRSSDYVLKTRDFENLRKEEARWNALVEEYFEEKK